MIKKTSIRAFTLIELLVVISIIGMLSSVVLASLSTAREKGRIGSIITFDTYNYRKLGANLIASYDFNELVSGKVPDKSGNGYDLTLGNSASLDSTNQPFSSGSSLNVDSQYKVASINLSSSQPLIVSSGSKGYTISIWAKTLYPSVNNRAFFEISGTQRSYLASCNSSNNLSISLSTSIVVNNSPVCSDSTRWHNLTISSNQGNAVVYVDGKSVYEGSVASESGANLLTYLAVGNGLPGTPTSFRGHIDNFNLYSEALTAMEVQHLYAEGLERIKLAESDSGSVLY